jgi:hypothetical protein
MESKETCRATRPNRTGKGAIRRDRRKEKSRFWRRIGRNRETQMGEQKKAREKS